MQVHELKTDAEVFNAVQWGRKTFEIRKNDRDFQWGDLLMLRREPEATWSGAINTELVRVTYLLPGGQYGIEEGYVAMGIERVKIEVVCD